MGAGAGSRRRDAALPEERVDLAAVHLEVDDPAVQPVDLDALVLVGLRDHPERVGADAQVRVHRDEDGRPAGVVLADVEGRLQDGLVHRGVIDGARQRRAACSGTATRSAPPESSGTPLDSEPPALAELVEEARDRARVAAALGALALELVDLLDHVDRDDDVVVLELEDGVRVVEEDVRVEDVVLLHSGRMPPSGEARA